MTSIGGFTHILPPPLLQPAGRVLVRVFRPERLMVLGIVKAYSTSVGGGPFPTELTDAQTARSYAGERSMARRPDGAALWMVRWRGYRLCVLAERLYRRCRDKLDVLDHFDTLKLCVAYRVGDEITLTMFPIRRSRSR